VSSVVNAADIIGATISYIDIKEHDQQDNGGDVLDITFYTIVTSRGRADVILHVEHNGYYGGRLRTPTKVAAFPPSALIPEP
jgi:hypothetical protein